MKYMLLIYSNPATWVHPVFLYQHEVLSDNERDAMKDELAALFKELHKSGELISAEPLADPGTVRTIRMVNGAPAITDGPFSEAKEQLAGCFVLDCESLERATAIAARFPDTRFGPVEVRPIMSLAGREM